MSVHHVGTSPHSQQRSENDDDWPNEDGSKTAIMGSSQPQKNTFDLDQDCIPSALSSISWDTAWIRPWKMNRFMHHDLVGPQRQVLRLGDCGSLFLIETGALRFEVPVDASGAAGSEAAVSGTGGAGL